MKIRPDAAMFSFGSAKGGKGQKKIQDPFAEIFNRVLMPKTGEATLEKQKRVPSEPNVLVEVPVKKHPVGVAGLVKKEEAAAEVRPAKEEPVKREWERLDVHILPPISIKHFERVVIAHFVERKNEKVAPPVIVSDSLSLPSRRISRDDSIQGFLKQVPDEALRDGMFVEVREKNGKQTAEKEAADPVRLSGEFFPASEAKDRGMGLLRETKVEIQKEIKNYADFQVVTPKKVIVSLDSQIGGAEVRIERIDQVIHVEARVEDGKAREQLEIILRDIKEEMGSKGLQLEFEVKEEERKEKRKEEGLLEEKRRYRGHRKQEGEQNGH